MPIYNLIECSDNYSKTSASLWQLSIINYLLPLLLPAKFEDSLANRALESYGEELIKKGVRKSKKVSRNLCCRRRN